MSKKDQTTATTTDFKFAKIFDYESGHQILMKKFDDDDGYKINFCTNMGDYTININLVMNEDEESIDKLFDTMDAEKAYKFLKSELGDVIF